MSKKPEALRLADELDVASLGIRACLESLSASALRRQHAKIERLKADNKRLREENEEMEVLFKALQEAFVRAKEAALRREEKK